MHALARVSFVAERDIGEASVDELWRRLSDVESIPKYWHGHREVNVLQKDGNIYHVTIRYAFPSIFGSNIGKSTVLVDEKMKAIKFDNTDGPVVGTITVRIDEVSRRLVCEYDVSVSSPMGSWVRKHFMSGVEHAFDRLLAQNG